MTKPSPEEVAAWVERTTAEQGVEAKITDARTIEVVAVLLREGREPQPVKDATSE